MVWNMKLRILFTLLILVAMSVSAAFSILRLITSYTLSRNSLYCSRPTAQMKWWVFCIYEKEKAEALFSS